MTALLEHALAKVRELPKTEQDAIAAIMLEEISDEARWVAAFARSQDRLVKLAEKARLDVRAGRVREAGFDEL